MITDLEGAIVKALTARNGRSSRVGDHDELLARLSQDGVRCDAAEYFAAIGRLTAAGTVVYQPGQGIWLAADALIIIHLLPLSRQRRPDRAALARKTDRDRSATCTPRVGPCVRSVPSWAPRVSYSSTN